MALKNYTVNIGGIEHTMQLNEADAKRYGKAAVLKPQRAKSEPNTKAATEPKNKSRTPAADKKSTPAADKADGSTADKADKSAETDW